MRIDKRSIAFAIKKNQIPSFFFCAAELSLIHQQIADSFHLVSYTSI